MDPTYKVVTNSAPFYFEIGYLYLRGRVKSKPLETKCVTFILSHQRWPTDM